MHTGQRAGGEFVRKARGGQIRSGHVCVRKPRTERGDWQGHIGGETGTGGREKRKCWGLPRGG